MNDEVAQMREAVEAIQWAERVEILRCPECGWQVLREHGVEGQRCEAIEIDAGLDCDGVCQVVSLVPAHLLDTAIKALREIAERDWTKPPIEMPDEIARATLAKLEGKNG